MTFPTPSPFLVRVSGLPWTTVEQLKLPGAASLLAQAAEIEDALERNRNEVSDRLGDYVPLVAGKERGAMLRVRRALFNGRAAQPTDVAAIGEVVADPVKCLVRDYASAIERRHHVAAALKDAVLHEEAACIERLSAICEDPHFSGALMLASPVLYEQWTKLKAQPALHSDAMGIVTSLSRYLLRAATKTSPFSAFTQLAVGRWSSGHAGVSLVPANRPSTNLQLSVGWLQAIEDWIYERQRDQEPLQLNASIWRVKGQAFAIKRKPSRRGLGVVQNSESLVAMTDADWLRAVESAGPVPATRAQWKAHLQRCLPLDDRKAGELCDKLKAAGVLQRAGHLVSTADDVWGVWLARFDPVPEAPCREADELLRIAKVTHAELTRLGFDNLPDRWKGLNEIYALRRSCVSIMDPGQPLHESSTRQFVFEDCATPFDVRIDAALSSGIGHDLRSALGIFAVHDSSIENAYDMAAQYRREAGESTESDFLDFFRTFHLDRQRRLLSGGHFSPWNSGGTTNPERGLGASADVSTILRLRAEMARELAQQLEADRETVQFSDADVKRWAAQHPWPFKAHARAGMFTMLAGPEPYSAVVNGCGLGYGKFWSRFLRLLPGNGQPGLHAAAKAACLDVPNGIAIAELRGFFSAYGVQAYPRIAPYEIQYPGEPSDGGSETLINLSDLFVRYNRATKLLELVSRRLGQVVWPVHLGFLTPSLAPPLFRALMELGPPFALGTGRPHAWKAHATPGGEVIRAPRITVGQVVLSRAAWAVPTTRLRFDQEPIAFWTNLERFRKQVGIPQQVFRKSQLFQAFMAGLSKDVAESAAAQEKAGTDAAVPADLTSRKETGTEERISPNTAYKDEARKPMYMDFQDFNSVRLFWKSQALQGDKVLFDEVYPTPEQSVLRENGRARTAECVFEVVGW